jgi:integrase
VRNAKALDDVNRLAIVSPIARTIAKACARAGVPHWHPNQLRHNFATLARRQFGSEAAQVVLGHSRADMTQVYAERDLANEGGD